VIDYLCFAKHVARYFYSGIIYAQNERVRELSEYIIKNKNNNN